MAKKQNEEEPSREEIRDLALKRLKGELGVLYFCNSMQAENRPFGQNGLALSHNLFMSYLNHEEIKDYVIESLKKTEAEAVKRGAGFYGGQASSKNVITKGSEDIKEYINFVYVSDIAEILGIKCSKFKDKYVGDLNEKNASKEEKELYRAIMTAYDASNTHTYMSESTAEYLKLANNSLEALVG